MNRLSPILSNPSSASSTLPGDSLDNATARPTAIPLGERGTCPNDSSSDHAQHVTPPTAADLGKLQYSFRVQALTRKGLQNWSQVVTLLVP